MKWYAQAAGYGQRGQTLPLGLALIFFALLGVLLLYDTSQLATEKTRLANSADAAAYSGLIWQARALNFQAYTNRAMVANELSIAQIVSLNSWSKYAEITSRNINNTIGLIPVVRPFTQGVASAAQTADEIVSTIATAGVNVVSGLNMILSEIQRGVYLGTFIMTPEVVKAVIEANDPSYTFDSVYSVAAMGRNLIDWQSFTDRYDDAGGQARLAELINRSRHDFVRDRNWSTATLPVNVAPPTRLKLVKEGAAQLEYEDGQWIWRARDTLSIHQEVYRCKPFRCRWRHTEIPVGWGEVYAGDDLRCQAIQPGTHAAGFSYGYGCGNLSPRNTKAGWAAGVENDGIGGYRGLHAYYDLRDLSESNQDPRLILRVKVGQPGADLRTTSHLAIGADPSDAAPPTTPSNGVGPGMFRMDEQLGAGALQSLGSAELYFKRPDHDPALGLRVNGASKREYASLFNPYWQVRLAPTEQVEQLLAWADDGLTRGVAQSMAEGSGAALARYADRQQAELEGVTDLVAEAKAEIAKIGDYTQRLGDISQRLDNTESHIVELRLQLDAAAPGSDAAASAQVALDQALRVQSDLTAQAAALEQRLDLALRYAAQQEQLDAYVAGLQNQLQAALPEAVAGLPAQYASAEAKWHTFKDFTSGDAWQAAGQAIADLGTDYLQDIVADYAMEQAKGLLKQSLSAILQRYGGSYAQQLEQMKATADKAQQALASASASTIEPLLAQLEGLENQVQALQAGMEVEAAKLVGEIQQEIDLLASNVSQSIATATAPLQDRLAQLNQQLSLLGVGPERDAVAAEIAAVQAEIADITNGAAAALDRDVAELMAAKDQIVAETKAAFEQEINQVRDDIAALRAKVEALQAQLNQEAV